MSASRSPRRPSAPWVSLALVTVLAGVGGASSSVENDRLSSEEAKLELVRDRLQSVEKELASLDEHQTSLLGELHRLEIQIRVAREQLELLKLQLAQGYRKIDENLARIQELERSIDELRPYLTRRSASLYKLGRLSYLRLLLSIEEPGELTRAYRYISRLARADAEKMSHFLSDEAALRKTKAELSSQTERMLATRNQLERMSQVLERRRKNKDDLLDEMTRRREMAETLMHELEDARGKLEALVERLLEGDEVDKSDPVLVPIRLFRGELGWPVAGKVEIRFGKQLHPRFRTVTVHNGIEIEAKLGTPVRAVYDGLVVFASWFEGYGKLLILSHPHNLYTLYGHLSEIGVSQGERVSSGQEVARVGDTGSLAGASLYFEIRDNGKPVDPEQWLARPSRLAGAEEP